MVEESQDLEGGEVSLISVDCPEGKVVLSGGVILGEDATLLYDAPTEEAGWLARASCAEDAECTVTVRAICAVIAEAETE